MHTFIWFPVASVRKRTQPNVAVAKFGDGYEQRTAYGINHQPENWSLEFSGNREEMAPIEAFLKARGGYGSFEWKTPDEETGRFVCRSWEKVRDRGFLVTISCEFEQVFE